MSVRRRATYILRSCDCVSCVVCWRVAAAATAATEENENIKVQQLESSRRVVGVVSHTLQQHTPPPATQPRSHHTVAAPRSFSVDYKYTQHRHPTTIYGLHARRNRVKGDPPTSTTSCTSTTRWRQQQQQQPQQHGYNNNNNILTDTIHHTSSKAVCVLGSAHPRGAGKCVVKHFQFPSSPPHTRTAGITTTGKRSACLI